MVGNNRRGREWVAPTADAELGDVCAVRQGRGGMCWEREWKERLAGCQEGRRPPAQDPRWEERGAPKHGRGRESGWSQGQVSTDSCVHI